MVFKQGHLNTGKVMKKNITLNQELGRVLVKFLQWLNTEEIYYFVKSTQHT